MSIKIEGIKKAAAYLRANGADFRQSSSKNCVLAMILRSGGFVSGAMGTNLPASLTSPAVIRGVDITGLPAQTVADFYNSKFPEGVEIPSTARGAAFAEVAAKMLESFLPSTAAPASTVQATDKSARIIKALLFAGKIRQSDVDAAAALFA